MPDQLASKRALRALVADVPGVGFVEGRFTLRPEPQPCHSFANGCECGCKPRSRKAPAPQPWESRKAA